MIDFDEEIKRFSPSLEVSQADEDIYKNDLKDIADIVLQMTEDLRGTERKQLWQEGNCAATVTSPWEREDTARRAGFMKAS